MKQIRIGQAGGSAFSIPVDFVTQTSGVLARKGAGKTYTASVMAEGLLQAGQQLVVIDPLDAWWGLRSSADGKGPGFPVIVFGGSHGDLPLGEQTGKRLADLVAENPRMSCILSLRHLRKARQRQFVMDFAEQLFHRKGHVRLATPVHLMIDEADMFAPQRVMGDVARLVGAMEDIVRRGRQAGIGVTMISQRSASINKDVLTQVELLIVGQLTGPQDKKAIKEWIEHNATVTEQASFMASLAKLDVGEMWFWSPSWLDCMKRVKVQKRITFDSSATPKAGRKPRTPKKRAVVDLDKLRRELEDVVATAEANDPRALKRDVSKLQAELKKALLVKPVAKVDVTAAVKAAVAKAIERRDKEWADVVAKDLLPMARAWSGMERSIRHGLVEFGKKVQAIMDMKKPAGAPPVVLSAGITKPTRPLPPPTGRAGVRRPSVGTMPVDTLPPLSDGKVTKCERAILTVLAQRSRPCNRRLIALQSGYSVTSGSFRNSLGSLRGKGFITKGGSIDPAITEAGLDALGHYEPLPEGQALVDYWAGKLNKCMRAIFVVAAEAYPEAMTRDAVAEATGYTVTSGSFRNSVGSLRTLELIERVPEVLVTAEVFE